MERAFTTAQCFCDHAVLQRNASTSIWGKGIYENQKISVRIGEYSATATVGYDLNWRAFLHDMKECAQPQELIIQSDGESIVYKDVLIGEVWLVTGQSNAELSFRPDEQTRNYHKKTLENASAADNIRAIIQHRESIVAAGFEETTYPHEDFLDPQMSAWKVLDNEEVTSRVSMLGYYFAKNFAEATGIPVGIVTAACSSSPIQEIMPKELAKALNLCKKRTFIDIGGAYNTMISPIEKMTFSGILFYQGESEMDNAPRHVDYDYILAAYVAEMRRRLGNIPFYYVQISSHPEPERSFWHFHNVTRNVQFNALRLIPDSGMIVSRDCGWRKGDMNMYHPYHKDILGKRLCDLALAHKFHALNIEYVTSPEPVFAKYYADRVEIKYRHVGDGLCLFSGSEVLGFELSSGRNEYVPAKAKITSKDTVTVTGLKNADSVRFGFEYLAYPEVANIQNSSGLPSPCFELRKDRI